MTAIENSIKIRCKYDELMPIVELKKLFHPKNTNKHSTKQIERLAKILEYSGIRQPATISNLSGNMTKGHCRVLAAEKAGETHYPVVYEDYDDMDMEIADITADNAIALWADLDFSMINDVVGDLGPDFDIDLLGIDGFEIDVADKDDGEEDSIPQNVETRCKLGDLWTLGDHRLLCGDSTNIQHVDTLMSGEKADMVFTDPPYNINFKPQRGTHDKIKNDNMSDEDFTQFLKDIFNNCKIVMKEDTYLISFMGWSTIPEFKNALKELFTIKSMPIWVKNNFGIGYYTRPKYEPFYLCLNGDPVKPDKAPADVFEYAKVYKTVHSCEKPVKMISDLISLFKADKLLYEPFGGSGSTLIACDKTNRKCFTMELEPKYCDVILKRWEEYTGQEAQLENNTI